MKFLSHLDMELMWNDAGFPLRNRDGRQLYQLLADFSYQSDIIPGAGYLASWVITAPKTFVTDLGSIPRIPLVYDALGDIIIEEAVIHDYLYSKGEVPRAMADKVLLEAMELTGIPWIKRKLIYAGVRIGGRSHYAAS